MPTEQEAVLGLPDSSNICTAYQTISQSKMAWQDFVQGLKNWRIWFMLAYQDIKLRYRRSVLGPFWLTLSMAITVYTMGFLYSHIFHVDLQHYFPFLVAGMLSWSLISTLIIEQTDVFVGSDTLIKQIKLPYTLHVHRIVTRNLLIFFHNIFVIVPILAIFHEVAKVNLNTLFLIPGLLLIYVNAMSYGLILAMLGARYRDISQVIKSLIQVVFFVTPIMWGPQVLLEKSRWLVDLNPLYPFVEFIRAPLIGQLPTMNNFIMAFIVTGVGLCISAKMFIRYRNRIIYWL